MQLLQKNREKTVVQRFVKSYIIPIGVEHIITLKKKLFEYDQIADKHALTNVLSLIKQVYKLSVMTVKMVMEEAVRGAADRLKLVFERPD